MELKRIDHNFSICKVKDFSQVDLEDKYCFTGKTDEEYSLVCRTEKVPENVLVQEDGWKMFRIQGELDLSLLGILAEIAGLLSENHISIFAISTFNTDYILTKKEDYERALRLLDDDGYALV